MTALKEIAKELFMAAVDRADPARALRGALADHPLPTLPDGGRYLVLAIGKAAAPMMREALDHVPAPREALVVTNPENLCEIPGARVIEGSHPVPDAKSAAAGQAVIDLLATATENDRVIALISGGGSALMVAPAAGLTLADKSELNALLLGSGLEINDMNLIRQQVSDLKGGGLLRHAAPAPVTAYILSDVIGDDLRAIASGPTVAPIADRRAAQALMESAGIWQDAPDAIRGLLATEAAPTPNPEAANHLIGSNRHSLEAMLAAVPDGFTAQIVSDALTGDVGDAVEEVLKAAEAAPTDHPVALIFGGETTVQLKGDGLGGRNQELALRLAAGAAGRLSGDWVFLSGGTDGRDGPTEVAGGLVDGHTAAAVGAAGGDLDALLSNNDSFQALKLADALLMTGGTGTNVADVQVFLRRP